MPLTPDAMRIDLVGVTLDIVGPGGIQGPQRVFNLGAVIPQGNAASGVNPTLTWAQLQGLGISAAGQSYSVRVDVSDGTFITSSTSG